MPVSLTRALHDSDRAGKCWGSLGLAALACMFYVISLIFKFRRRLRSAAEQAQQSWARPAPSPPATM